MRLLPTSKLGRTIFGAVVGGAVGLLTMLGLMVLCVVVCVAVAPGGGDYEGERWFLNLSAFAFWGGLIAGPLLGAFVGARRMRRGPCPPCTNGKPAR